MRSLPSRTGTRPLFYFPLYPGTRVAHLLCASAMPVRTATWKPGRTSSTAMLRRKKSDQMNSAKAVGNGCAGAQHGSFASTERCVLPNRRELLRKRVKLFPGVL